MASNTLASNLDRMMSAAKISSYELGRILSLPSATIKKLRTGGNSNPTLSTLWPLAQYFGLTISQLIGESQVPLPKVSLPHAKEITAISVPIIAWEEIRSWPKSLNMVHQNYAISEFKINKDGYALIVDSEEYGIFQKDGILVVDPLLKYSNRDYVLVYKDGQLRPSIKRILEDEGSYYMQSLISDINSTLPLLPDCEIVGVIVEYKKNFK